MASTYSTNLGIELMGTGDQSGTWGATTNTNLGTLLEQAIAGYGTQAVTDSGTATVLTISNGASSTGRNAVIALTGALTAARVVEVPAKTKSYIFYNATTGGFAVTVKVTGQTGVSVPNGTKALVYCDGTDVRNVLSNITVDASGNVGIGTSSPTQTAANRTVLSVNGTTTSLINLNVGGVSKGYLYFNGTDTSVNATTGLLVLQNDSASSITFNTNGASERMRIDSSGNVGIGTSSPTSFGSTSRVLQVQSSDATGYGSVLVGSGTYTMEMLVNQNSGVMSIGSRSNHNLGFATNDTVRATIDTSGNVGIGTTSPSNRLTISDTGSGLNRDLAIRNGDATNYHQLAIGYNASTLNSGVPANSLFMLAEKGGGYGTVGGLSLGTIGEAPTVFINNGTETARIDSSGNLLLGTTSVINYGKLTISSANVAASFTTTASAGSGLGLDIIRSSATGDMMYFHTSSSANLAGYITCPTSTTTSYVSVSDYRLKENVTPIATGLEKILALKPVTYDWISDKLQGEGFIAHELQEVIPLAVAGEKDAVNKDGSIKPQGVDPAKIVVHLVAAIQELSAKNDALEARLTTLESK